MRRRVLALAVLACAIAGSTATAKGLRFPDGFRWRTAISGFQSDMGVGAPNDEGTDWVWTHDPQNVASGSVSGAFPEDGPGFWTLFDFIPVLAYDSPIHPGGQPCPSTCTDFGWEIYPQGLREVLEFAGTLGLPIYLTENGLADAHVTLRGKYLYDHLAVLQQAITDHVADVRGYFHWSLTDNYEWSSGYAPKFGAFTFDPETGKRKLRKGAKVLAETAKANVITPKLAKKYGNP